MQSPTIAAVVFSQFFADFHATGFQPFSCIASSCCSVQNGSKCLQAAVSRKRTVGSGQFETLETHPLKQHRCFSRESDTPNTSSINYEICPKRSTFEITSRLTFEKIEAEGGYCATRTTGIINGHVVYSLKVQTFLFQNSPQKGRANSRGLAAHVCRAPNSQT